MSVLVLLMSPRSPVGDAPGLESSGAGDARTSAAREWPFLLSPDGLKVERSGMATATQLPAADQTVLVLTPGCLSWRAVNLPNVPSGRLREALAGALEDDLAEAPGQDPHWALQSGPRGVSGTSWVAVVNRPALAGALRELSAAGRFVERAVPLAEPSDLWEVHAETGPEGRPWITATGPEGVLRVPLDWPGWTARVPADAEWACEPATFAAVRERIGREPRLIDPASRLLQRARGGTDLLQFDLKPSRKGWRALAAAWREITDRRWRLVHVGLAALVLVQWSGLQARAWQTRDDLRQLSQAQVKLLQATFPDTVTVVDPPQQMERAAERLRRHAGMPAPDDLDSWLDAAARAREPESGPLQGLAWNDQGLHLKGSWTPPAVERMRAHAAGMGWTVSSTPEGLMLQRPGGALR